MEIHEYQAKQILCRAGIIIPEGRVCFSVDESISTAQELGGECWVVKAQIHAGGRGKGGGILIASSVDVRKEIGDSSDWR